jgi:hypothetical protein
LGIAKCGNYESGNYKRAEITKERKLQKSGNYKRAEIPKEWKFQKSGNSKRAEITRVELQSAECERKVNKTCWFNLPGFAEFRERLLFAIDGESFVG